MASQNGSNNRWRWPQNEIFGNECLDRVAAELSAIGLTSFPEVAEYENVSGQPRLPSAGPRRGLRCIHEIGWEEVAAWSANHLFARASYCGDTERSGGRTANKRRCMGEGVRSGSGLSRVIRSICCSSAADFSASPRSR